MKIVTLLLASFLSAPLALAESAKSLLIPVNAGLQDFSQRDSVSGTLVAADIQKLTYALRKAYGGYSALKAQIETDTIPALEALPLAQKSTAEICLGVGKILDRIPDNHISVRYLGSNERCGKTPARPATVGPNIRIDKSLPWAVTRVDVGGKLVPVVSITAMMLSTSATWDGFLENIREIYHTAPALIIDLRGNSGGDDNRARAMANILAGRTDESSNIGPPARLRKSQTAESMALFSNFFLYVLKAGNADGSPADPSFQTYYDRFMDEFRAAEAGTLPAVLELQRLPDPLDQAKIFQGPIRILIDAGCASSCESAVTFFERFPNVKKVGENTGGFFHFGNVGKLWMNHSNVFVHLPIQSWLYDDGRYIEKVGIAPDVRVSSGSDALDAAKADLLLEFGQN